MFKKEKPYLGAAYYPEAWDKEQVDEDIAIMKKMGINAVRIAEFAWSTMEPREGEYDFTLMRSVVDKCRQNDIAVIMGTPSACPPYWLSDKYPEIMQVNLNGKRAKHMGRRYVCSTNKKFRELCGKIVTAMALEFKDDDNIIGWQIDNELYITESGGKGCCCPDCLDEFKNQMQEKYKTIDKLNSAWNNFIFSLNFDNFDQIYTPENEGWLHPSYIFEWYEFQNRAHIDFAHYQVDILKKYVNVPIGTDMMPFLGVDYVEMNKKMDIVQYNHYNDEANQWSCAFWYDYMRCIKNKPFWVTETSTCWNGSLASSPQKAKNFCIANSWLPITLGATANCYWLWRAHWGGAEMQHGSVVDSWGRELHIGNEVKRLAKEFDTAKDMIMNSYPKNNGIALHHSHLSWIMNMNQSIVNTFNYPYSVRDNTYRPLLQRQLRPDVIPPSAELDMYKMLITPYVFCIEEGGLDERVYKWVENGGTWIVGPMSDIRTPAAAKYKNAPLGHIEDWTGTRIEFTLPIGEEYDIVYNDGRSAKSISMIFDALSTSEKSESLAKYNRGYLEGYSAISQTKIGKGRIILIGCILAPNEFGEFVSKIADEIGIKPITQASENVVTAFRDGSYGEVFTVVEVENKPAYAVIPFDGQNIITSQKYKNGERVEIPPFEVLLVKKA